ncbi:hypothetical protein NDU88_003157 [Pleurodeles waltl]|uniref:Uncharacterized protein n=1 Tax=Pleurodeles waltl TaxID=8319 RepID=A0AAV7VGK0_PLEWA|nr:hypothetical protein NDU88_003157 [Pleurodeles waltl]
MGTPSDASDADFRIRETKETTDFKEEEFRAEPRKTEEEKPPDAEKESGPKVPEPHTLTAGHPPPPNPENSPSLHANPKNPHKAPHNRLTFGISCVLFSGIRGRQDDLTSTEPKGRVKTRRLKR